MANRSDTSKERAKTPLMGLTESSESQNIPSNFRLVRLGYLCSLQGGLTVDGARDNGRDVVTRPYLRVANVQTGHVDLDSVSEITVPRIIAERSTLRPGDVLMTEGGDLDKLGRGTVWGGELEHCLHQNHVFALRPNPEKLTSNYLAWVTQSLYGRYYFESTGVKTTNLASTSSSKILDFLVPLPPLGEQHRITDFLDAEIAHIDKLVSTKRRAVGIIDERRVALTSQLCLRGIREEAAVCDSGIVPIGTVPAHWTVTRNKNLMAEVIQLSEDGTEELLTVSHLTGVTPRNEKNVSMFMAESMAGYKICQPNNLVINTMWAWMGALGVSRHSGIVSPAYGVYRFRSDDVFPDYFDLLYRTPEYVCEMTRNSKGVWTSRLRLYPESFLALSAPLPPKHEQQEIVKLLDGELEPENRLKSAIQRSNALLAERR